MNLYGGVITAPIVNLNGGSLTGYLNPFLDNWIVAPTVNNNGTLELAAGTALRSCRMFVMGDVAGAGQVILRTRSRLSGLGDLTVGGLDMYGATIDTFANMTVNGPFVTHSDVFGQADVLNVTTLTNNGTIRYDPASILHTLALAGSFLHGLNGTLEMRLNNGLFCDVFTIGGNVTLRGILTLTALEPLVAGQTWNLIAIGGALLNNNLGNGNNFAARIFPDAGGWATDPLGYTVTKLN